VLEGGSAFSRAGARCVLCNIPETTGDLREELHNFANRDMILVFYSCTSSIYNSAQRVACDVGNQLLVFALVGFVLRHKAGDVLALRVSVNV
jgi:hypothetical protein